MHIDLVSLTPEDLAATGEVLKAAYNVPNSREETLRRYLALQPESFCQQRTLSHMRHGRLVPRGRRTTIYGQISLGPG